MYLFKCGVRSDVGLITSDRLGAGTRDREKCRDRDGLDWTLDRSRGRDREGIGTGTVDRNKCSDS